MDGCLAWPRCQQFEVPYPAGSSHHHHRPRSMLLSLRCALRRRRCGGVAPGLPRPARAARTAATVPASGGEDARMYWLRDATARVLALAMRRVYGPRVVPVGGPLVTEQGFSHDFLLLAPQQEPREAEAAEMEAEEGKLWIGEGELAAVQKEMARIMRRNLPFAVASEAADAARRRGLETHALRGEDVELALREGSGRADDQVAVVRLGQQQHQAAEEEGDDNNMYWDVLRGGGEGKETGEETLSSWRTGDINPEGCQLLAVGSVYWRGDETQPRLQRVSGTVWPTGAELEAYLELQKRLREQDHRVLGTQLGLFSLQEQAGGGLVFWHPNGAFVRHQIEELWRAEHLQGGYQFVYTPHIASQVLWQESGHLDYFEENMFQSLHVDQTPYRVRPMNCPFHCLMYKSAHRSYRELPMRWAELGTVYRNERSGTLHGLLRLRGFTQDDAHIFCTPDQLEDEIVGVLQLTERLLRQFGFTEYDVALSTRPTDSIGDDATWERATDALAGALRRMGWSFEEEEGEGAFYGPKIDVSIRDGFQRTWQCSTIQCDLNLPTRFGLHYTDEHEQEQRPILVHRAVLGSIERFFGVLTEHYNGLFPLWMAPTLVRLLPIARRHEEFCDQAAEELRAALPAGHGGSKHRIHVDASRGRLSKKVRAAHHDRMPLMAAVGDKEVGAGTLSLRTPSEDLGTVSVSDLAEGLHRAQVERWDVPDLVHHLRENGRLSPSSPR